MDETKALWDNVKKSGMLITDSEIAGFVSKPERELKGTIKKENIEKLVFSEMHNIPKSEFDEYGRKEVAGYFEDAHYSAEGCPCSYPASFLLPIIEFVEKMGFGYYLLFPAKEDAPMFVVIEDSYENILQWAVAPRKNDIYGNLMKEAEIKPTKEAQP